MTWLSRLFRRRQLEHELDKELRFHLDQHVADLIAQGDPPDEALRKAGIALGGPQQVREKCRDARGTRWIDDLFQDIRYALRSIRQRPGFTAVTLATLALGIGATTVMFTVINGVLLRPLSYPQPERLLSLHGHTDRYGNQWVSYQNFLDIRHLSRSFAAAAAWTYGGDTISEPGQAEYADGRAISSGLFAVFGVPLAAGRAFLPDEDRPGTAPVAIISYGLWQRRFGGSAAALGERLVYGGKPYTVVGVAPAGFQLDGDADVFTPLGQNTEPRMQNREAKFLNFVARRRPGITLSQAQAELRIIGSQLSRQYPKSNAGQSFRAIPLRQELVGNVRSTLWLLLGAVGLVLLIGCVNVASLLLARAVSRDRELAMRVALGATRGRLVRQYLTETAVLGLLGGALGLVLALAGTRPFVVFWPGSLPRAEAVRLDPNVLLFALTASLASGLFFGLAPALRAPTRDLEQTLRSGGRALTAGARRLHSGFVTFEIALALILLVASGTLGRTVLRLSSLDPGIDPKNVLVTHVALSPGVLQQSPAEMRAAWSDVVDRARRLRGVQFAALSDIVPMRVGENALGYWTTPAPPPPDQMPLALASCVTPDYLKVMRIPLRQGRFFDDHDRPGTEPVVVIDEVLARHAFPHENAVGRRLFIQAMGPAPVRVIGVVGHVRHWGLAEDDQSRVRDQAYYPFAQVPERLMRLFSSFMSLTVRTTVSPLTVVEPLRLELPNETVYDVHSMEQLASASIARQRFLMTLFGIFAGLALLLSCIGIYGLLACVTSQRVSEIGLRMALGATARDVVGLVLSQSLRMVVVGAGVGLAGAVAAVRFIERSVAGVRATSPSTFVVMVAVLLIAALLATFLPARRASRVDPMRALRQE